MLLQLNTEVVSPSHSFNALVIKGANSESWNSLEGQGKPGVWIYIGKGRMVLWLPLPHETSSQIRKCLNFSLKRGIGPVGMARRTFHSEEMTWSTRRLVCIISLKDSTVESCGCREKKYAGVSKPELVEDRVHRAQSVVWPRCQNQSRTRWAQGRIVRGCAWLGRTKRQRSNKDHRSQSPQHWKMEWYIYNLKEKI